MTYNAYCSLSFANPTTPIQSVAVLHSAPCPIIQMGSALSGDRTRLMAAEEFILKATDSCD